MLNKCDVLILTTNFGSGHEAVAKVIKSRLKKQAPHLSVEIIDIYKMLHPNGYRAIYRGYEILVKHFPYIYNQYYYGKDSITFLKKMDTLSKLGIIRLRQFIKKTNPKVVISTFPSCTGYMVQYKKKHDSKLPLFTCITDAVLNNEWIYKENDCYFVADDRLKDGMVKKGVYEDQILVTGIPIRSKFFKNQEKNNYRKKLGYKENDKIVLIMGGSFGLLPKGIDFYRWLLNKEHVQVVVLASKNYKLYKQLKELNAPNLRVFGFCEQVSEYMAAANVLIGKSGGITLFEAIASQLPLIVYQPKLGQEVENSRFIIQKGIGYVANHSKDLKSTVLMVLQPNVQEQLQLNLINAKKAFHLDGLVSKIINTINNEKFTLS